MICVQSKDFASISIVSPVICSNTLRIETEPGSGIVRTPGVEPGSAKYRSEIW